MLSQLSQWLIAHSSEALTFMLVVARAGGLIVGAPFWGGRMVPLLMRIWISVVLAIAAFPLVKSFSLPFSPSILFFALALGQELCLGLMLGWAAQLLFAAMRLAGQAIEVKSGLGFVQLVDPHSGGTTGLFSALLELIAAFVFFALNGHHLLIQALLSSYAVFPLAGDNFPARLLAGVISSSGQIFAIGLRISAPVVIGLLLSDIALGILSRTIPQMNIFMVAQPLQFGLVILLLLLSLPALVWWIAGRIPWLATLPGSG